MDKANISPTAPDQELAQYLTFVLGGELFAIGILAIKEIIEYGKVTGVPMMPPFVRGVINLRGAVVPVLDLQARFGQGRTAAMRRTCIVIVEIRRDDEQSDVGILVDAVNEVVGIAAADIEAAPSFGSAIDTRFIAGMGKVDGQFTVILDVDRVADFADIAARMPRPEQMPELALAA